MEKVVITGMGAITSVGNNVNDFWNGLLEGKSGIKPITRVSVEEHETKIAGQADDEFENLVKKYWTKRQLGVTTAGDRMLLAAAGEAVDDSEVDFESYDGSRVGVIMGIVDSNFDDAEREKTNNIILKSMPSTVPSLISSKYGLNGASFNLSCACSSAGYAISVAASMIESGLYDMVVCGGMSGVITHDNLYGFNQILALSVNPDPNTACRPFSKNRDGFVMGEGAGALILESEASAKKRNAKIYATLKGYSFFSEASNMTAPLGEGEGMKIGMELALKKAGLGINDIDYINAHGTSTNLNDKYETMAIKNLFGERAYDIPVSSIKSSIGHCMGGGSAVEAIACIKALNEGILPPTINYDEADPELDLDYVPNVPKKKEIRTALSNSFGFGGQNSTLIFEKY